MTSYSYLLTDHSIGMTSVFCLHLSPMSVIENSLALAMKMYYPVLLFKKAFTPPLINIAKDSLLTNQLARAR